MVVEDLTDALADGIDELTRPIDAIKHQAKTVTVGISRSEEDLLQVALVREVLAAGAPGPALATGRCARWPRSTRRWTRSRLHPVPIEGDVEGGGEGAVPRCDRGGIGVMRRAASTTGPQPAGHQAGGAGAAEMDVTLVGRSDGRTVCS